MLPTAPDGEFRHCFYFAADSLGAPDGIYWVMGGTVGISRQDRICQALITTRIVMLEEFLAAW